MKLNFVVFLIGIVLGVLIPKKATVVEPIVKTVDKIVTQTKIIEHPGGTKTIEITKTQDRVISKSIEKPIKKNLLGLSKNLTGEYEVQYSRRLLGDFFISGAITTDKQLKLGIIYEF